MPGTKRKASFAFPYERPAKLAKSSSSTTVSRAGSLVKSPSLTGPKFSPLKFPSLRATKSATKEIALSSSGSSASSTTTPPSLRRASTLTLEDQEEKAGTSSELSGKRKSSLKSSKTPSLTRKASNVEEGALSTKLVGLRSGSIVGETVAVESGPVDLSRKDSVNSVSSSDPALRKTLTKKLSSKKSSVRKDGPSVPSGLTKLALTKSGTSLNIEDKDLIGEVGESEVGEALASLKSRLSKERSKSGLIDEVPTPVAGGSTDKAAADNSVPMDDEEPGTSVSAEPLPPPGGYLDVVISFDTTGSMMGCLNEVRAKVQNLVQKLQGDIPGIHIAIIAHGDYCDVDKYIVKWIDFGATLPEICDFVNNVEPTFGGDGPECYELVLLRAREVLSWRPGSQRVLIMIGDDVPHEPGYTYGGKTYHINWRDECKELNKMGVKVYGVQAGSHGGGAANFHREMAKLTNGSHLKLDKFESCFDFLMMICYREGNPDMLPGYEEEIRAREGRINVDVASCMSKLVGGARKKSSTSPKKSPKPTATKTIKKKTSKKITVTSVASKPKAKLTDKIRKTTKSKAAKKKITSKKKERKVNRTLKREKLTEAKFIKGPLKQLKWSKWVCAILPGPSKSKKDKPSAKKMAAKSKIDMSKFTNCRHLSGYRLKSLFDDDTTTPSIYEVAVQLGDAKGSKKHVMYYRRSVGWIRKGRWDMYLLKHNTIRKEVDLALAAGSTIWVRRGVPNGNKAQMKRLIKVYEYLRDNLDYAWKKYVWRRTDGRQKHRQVKVSKRGAKPIIISHDDI